jgi:hypothetical protein
MLKKEIQMKKVILGAALFLGLFASQAKSEVFQINSTELIPPTIATITANGGSLYGTIPSGGAGVKNCITDLEVSVSSRHPSGGFIVSYNYIFSITEGSPTTGTTIYSVPVSTMVNSAMRVEENRTRETALCGDFNMPLNFKILAPTPNHDPYINYQGYRRKNP